MLYLAEEYNSNSLRKSLEELLKLLLLIWCHQLRAICIISARKECDKKITVTRESGEFGFRIHGSRPVVVSAIEPGTAAENSGLEVGDVIMSINGTNVLDSSHSDVVKIAHSGADTLDMEVARTCHVLTPALNEASAGGWQYAGYLWRLGGGKGDAASRKWCRRWFTVKDDNCLYYFKNDDEQHPLGALSLHNCYIIPDDSLSRPYGFRIVRQNTTLVSCAAENEEAMGRWVEALTTASTDSEQRMMWVEQSTRLLSQSADTIQKPDCFGYLSKLGGRWRAWKRRYAVLKDAALYFYHDASASTALGAAQLHGYRVQSCSIGGKKHAFELIPPDPKFRHFYFYTDSDNDKKRWLAALEYSIDRWIKVG